ncbi:MAG TPA: hypothetical protein VHD62_05640 [Opitutaceae bacterium]|nr:hypothetical protein [Opitutaceae bacterium]
MKTPARLLPALLGLFAFGAAGCQNLDLATASDPQRIVTGAVNLRPDIIFPADTQVVVRVFETVAANDALRPASVNDLASPAGALPAQKIERVLAEKTIAAPAGKPVPFQIEFRADDDELRHGVNIEARISYDGKVRFRTLDAQLITLGTVASPHEVWVEAVR